MGRCRSIQGRPAINQKRAKAAFSVAQAVTAYMSIEGTLGGAGAHGNTFFIVTRPCVFRNMRAQAVTNTLSGSCVITFRKNDAATDLAITIPAADVTDKTNTANYVVCAAGDKINWQIAAAAGTGSIANIAISCDEYN